MISPFYDVGFRAPNVEAAIPMVYDDDPSS